MATVLSVLILAAPFAAYQAAGRLCRKIAPGGHVVMLPAPLYRIVRRCR